MFRFAALFGATALLVSAGCSSGDDDPVALEEAPTPTSAAAAPSSSTSPVPKISPTTTAPEVPQVVTVDVQIPDLAIDEVVSVEAEPTGDPFDDAFATCSAFRDVVGSYAVGAGGPDAELPWISIVSAARIEGAGEVAADVRIDLPDRSEFDAAGTLTLDAGLASGSFNATANGGAVVTGTFDCSGSEQAPVPMSATDTGAIEVVALLDTDERERVVTAATLGAVAADCPATTDEALVVRVDGDATLGAISTFEIAQGVDGATMRLRVGGTTYEFGDILLDLDDEARAGTFVAVGDVSVVGAFSCT